MAPGDRVNWLYTQRGYGFVIPVAAVVRKVTAARVVIALARKDGTGWVVEKKTVKPAKLTPRTRACPALGEGHDGKEILTTNKDEE